MDTSGQAAEMMVRYAMEGMEYTLKLTGKGTERLAAVLMALSKDQQKNKGKTLFFLVCLVLTIITHLWIQVGAFVFTFYLFRCRMGGWHANAIWSCQILSFVLLVGITLFIGPAVEYIPLFALIAIDTIIIIATYFVPPVYPKEAHFTQEIKRSNIQKKNAFLLILVVLQVLSMTIFGPLFLIYGMLGLVFTDISVLLQYFKIKNERMSQS